MLEHSFHELLETFHIDCVELGILAKLLPRLYGRDLVCQTKGGRQRQEVFETVGDIVLCVRTRYCDLVFNEGVVYC